MRSKNAENIDGENGSLDRSNPLAPDASEAPVSSAAKNSIEEDAAKAARMAGLLPRKHRFESKIKHNDDFKNLLVQKRAGSSPFKIQEEYNGFFSAHHVIPIRRLTYLYNYAFTFLFNEK